jgi:hypothetical protein
MTSNLPEGNLSGIFFVRGLYARSKPALELIAAACASRGTLQQQAVPRAAQAARVCRTHYLAMPRWIRIKDALRALRPACVAPAARACGAAKGFAF